MHTKRDTTVRATGVGVEAAESKNKERKKDIMKLETKLVMVVRELNRRLSGSLSGEVTEITINNGETDTTYPVKYFTDFKKVVETVTDIHYGNTSSKNSYTIDKITYGLAVAGRDSLKDLTTIVELPSDFRAAAISTRQEKGKIIVVLGENEIAVNFPQRTKKDATAKNNG